MRIVISHPNWWLVFRRLEPLVGSLRQPSGLGNDWTPLSAGALWPWLRARHPGGQHPSRPKPACWRHHFGSSTPFAGSEGGSARRQGSSWWVNGNPALKPVGHRTPNPNDISTLSLAPICLTPTLRRIVSCRVGRCGARDQRTSNHVSADPGSAGRCAVWWWWRSRGGRLPARQNPSGTPKPYLKSVPSRAKRSVLAATGLRKDCLWIVVRGMPSS